MAHGHDIPDSEVFFELLSKNSKIKMFFVVEEDITKMSKYLPTTPLKTVEGTRGIHQVITSHRHEIIYRNLSCFCRKNDWKRDKTCTCYFPSKPLSFNDTLQKKKRSHSRYKEIYTSSESEDDIECQDTDEEMTMDDLRTIIQKEKEELDPEMLESPSQDKIIQGTFILVDLLGENQIISKPKSILLNPCQII